MELFKHTFQTVLRIMRIFLAWRLVILYFSDLHLDSYIFIKQWHMLTALTSRLGEILLWSSSLVRVLLAEYWIRPLSMKAAISRKYHRSSFSDKLCLPSRAFRSHPQRPLPTTTFIDTVVEGGPWAGAEAPMQNLRVEVLMCATCPCVWVFEAILWKER